MKPVILDLFAGQGGAAEGYRRAGFKVICVDNKNQPNNPFEFIKMDAIEYLKTQDLSRYSAIHASPPCQKYSQLGAVWRSKIGYDYTHPDMIAETREALIKTGLPYIIENVRGAPLENAFLLCGRMFGEQYFRHRYFEANFFVLSPPHVRHYKYSAPRTSRRPRENEVYSFYGHFAGVPEVREMLGVPWMNQTGIAQCVPPVYTEWIGKRLYEIIAPAD